MFNIGANTVLFEGNVVFAQEQNVIKRGRLFANLVSGDVVAGRPQPKDFFGLLQNRSEPLEIEADLAEQEVGGVDRYGGDGSWVDVRLGSTTIKSRFVTVYHERSPATADVPTADLRKAGLSHILKLETSGDVLLTFQDQTAAADKAVFDISSNKVTFDGNVVLTQGQNIIKDFELVVYLTKGYAITGRALWELPRKVPKGNYPPVFEIWGKPSLPSKIQEMGTAEGCPLRESTPGR